MPEKLVTRQAPDDYTADRLESTIDAFVAVSVHVQNVMCRLSEVTFDISHQYGMMVGASADISRRELPDYIWLQSFEVEAKHLLVHLDVAMAELQRAREKLLEMRDGSDAEPQQEAP